LIGLLFLFVRQKIGAFEARLNLLTDTVQTMAGLNRFEEVEEEDEEDKEDEEDEEDEEEEDEEEDEEEEDEEVKTEWIEKIENVVQEPEVIDLSWEPEVKTITLEKRIVSDDHVEYESLSLKELKDKVTEAGGPKLRTKKELIEFLKNKI